MLKLNPYAKVARRSEAILSEKRAAYRADHLAKARAGKKPGPMKPHKATARKAITKATTVRAAQLLSWKFNFLASQK